MRGRALECVTKRFLARQHRDSRIPAKRIVGNPITRNPHSKETSISLKIINLNSFPRFW
jgi:hypothetical protein